MVKAAAVTSEQKFLIAAYFGATIMPSEFYVSIGGLTLLPLRLLLLIAFFFAVARILSPPRLQLKPFDYAVIFGAVWLVLAHVAKYDFGKGLELGGSLALQSLGAYALARAYVRGHAQFQIAQSYYFLAILVVAAIAVPEVLTGVNWAHAVARALTGVNSPEIVAETRMGLSRAYSTFDHPIVYGTFCASAFGLIWHLSASPLTRQAKIGLICVATLFSLSSAPFLAIAMSIGFILWERLTRGVPKRLVISLALFAGAYVFIDVFSDRSPMAVFISYMTLNPWTGYYRMLIWENGIDDVIANPFFGIREGEWTRPAWMTDSVDNFWLVTAFQGGLPYAAALILAALLLLRAVHRDKAPARDRTIRNARFGWTIMTVSMCVVGFTVHYWGVMNSLLFFFLGMGAWMADGPAPARRRAMPFPGPRPITQAVLRPAGAPLRRPLKR